MPGPTAATKVVRQRGGAMKERAGTSWVSSGGDGTELGSELELTGFGEAGQARQHGVKQLLAAELGLAFAGVAGGVHHGLLADDGHQSAAGLELVEQCLGGLGHPAD